MSQGAAVSRVAMPRLVMASGTIEAFKWVAAALMVLDHLNKFLLEGRVHGFFELGRLVLPLFGFALAYSLARLDADRGDKVYERVMVRLACAGMIAMIPCMGLGGLTWGWWPANVMFMFVVAVASIYAAKGGGTSGVACAALTVFFGGLFVESAWFGIAYVVTAWWYCEEPSLRAFVAWLAATAALAVENHSGSTFGALILIFALSGTDLGVPRIRHLFYWFYPAHLLALWALR